MVRPLRVVLILAATVGLALVVGCGSDSSSGAAEGTTTAAPPATTAPATTAPATTAPATTEETTTEAPPESEGDAAAGETVFAASCTACHTNGGQEAGVGPKLAGAGLTADGIKTQVENGGGAMPGNLVSGDDLDDVVAYVVSIQ